MNERGLGGKQV